MSKYEQERDQRVASEAREAELRRELEAQRAERIELTAQIESLARDVGTLETQIEQQNEALSVVGASSNKLNSDIARLQADLGSRNARLAGMNSVIQAVTEAQQKREAALELVYDQLNNRYEGKTGKDITIVKSKDAVVITFSDKSIFSGNIMHVSEKGRGSLAPMASLLAERPELDAEIVSFTDNQLPKNKKLSDTWDWSLFRATNIIRLLIKEMNVNGNQLTPVGKGEFYPVSGNNSPEGRAINRRTEVVIRVPMPELPAFIQRP